MPFDSGACSGNLALRQLQGWYPGCVISYWIHWTASLSSPGSGKLQKYAAGQSQFPKLFLSSASFQPRRTEPYLKCTADNQTEKNIFDTTKFLAKIHLPKEEKTLIFQRKTRKTEKIKKNKGEKARKKHRKLQEIQKQDFKEILENVEKKNKILTRFWKMLKTETRTKTRSSQMSRYDNSRAKTRSRCRPRLL